MKYMVNKFILILYVLNAEPENVIHIQIARHTRNSSGLNKGLGFRPLLFKHFTIKYGNLSEH